MIIIIDERHLYEKMRAMNACHQPVTANVRNKKYIKTS